jgi:tetratricopeptide (TPR) repeat protein
MRISLLSPVRKAAFLSGCITAGILVWALCWQALAEYWVTRSASVEGFQKAARIQPLNAYYPRVLGTNLIQTNFVEAAAMLEESAAINPHASRTWLSLSQTYGVLGNHEKQHQAIVNALAADPKDVDIEWDASMFLIQNGDVVGGLQLVRDVITNDPTKVAEAMQTAYRATGGDVDRTIQAIPATAAARMKFLRWLVEHDQPAAADRVWPSAISAEGKLQARDLFFYIDSLISRHEVAQAYAVWTTLGGGDPDIQRRIEPGNLFINGDFEYNLLNGGFGWHYAKTDGVTVTMDTTTFHAGTRSLSLQFDADSISDAGIYELVPVEPATRYNLRGYMHSEELESANGVKLAALDYYSSSVLSSSEEILGSTSWRESITDFVTGPDTRLVKISLIRSPSYGRIRGKLWVDDLTMEKRP